MKISFKKSEVSNRLIINVNFWLFELIFRFWNNQDLFDGWFFQNHKFSVESQDLVLWINQLSTSDFLKDIFHTWCFFSRTLSFGQREKRYRTCGRKNIFRHREFKKRRGEIKKRFDVLIKTPKRFYFKRRNVFLEWIFTLSLNAYLPAFFTYFSNQAFSSYNKWRMFSLAE